jgi:hypothetical protein
VQEGAIMHKCEKNTQMKTTTQAKASAKEKNTYTHTQLTNYKPCKTKQKTKTRTKNNTKHKTIKQIFLKSKE